MECGTSTAMVLWKGLMLYYIEQIKLQILTSWFRNKNMSRSSCGTKSWCSEWLTTWISETASFSSASEAAFSSPERFYKRVVNFENNVHQPDFSQRCMSGKMKYATVAVATLCVNFVQASKCKFDYFSYMDLIWRNFRFWKGEVWHS